MQGTTLSNTPSPRVRDARDDDMPAIHAIYAHHVLHGRASMEEAPPTLEDMRARRAAVLEKGLPYLVAELELDGRPIVAGYAYATAYRPRSGYRHTVENSIYLDDRMRGRGVGAVLLSALLARCEQGPWRQMIAVIACPAGNEGEPSIALHRRMGFRHAARLEAVGYKHGQWIDTVLMQRALGPGAADPPPPPKPNPNGLPDSQFT
ncbi:N-acetyltransferase family protein [Paracidovorax citrulli]